MVLGHLEKIQPGFARRKRGKGLLRRIKVRIHAVDFGVRGAGILKLVWEIANRVPLAELREVDFNMLHYAV